MLSLPAGDTVEDTIRDLLPLCLRRRHHRRLAATATTATPMRRALALSQQGLRYIDAGVWGGIHGLRRGLLPDARRHAEVDRDLRAVRAHAGARHPRHGWLHCGPSGAGHYAKMLAQRHRVRNRCRARRGLRAARGAPGPRHRPRRASPTPGATAAWCAPGCSTSAPTSSRKTRPWPRSRRWSPTPAKGAGPCARVDRARRADAGRSPRALMSRFSSQGRSDYARAAARHDARQVRRSPALSREASRHDRRADGRLRRGQDDDRPASRAALGWPFIDADDYHPSANVAKMAAGVALAIRTGTSKCGKKNFHHIARFSINRLPSSSFSRDRFVQIVLADAINRATPRTQSCAPGSDERTASFA